MVAFASDDLFLYMFIWNKTFVPNHVFPKELSPKKNISYLATCSLGIISRGKKKLSRLITCYVAVILNTVCCCVYSPAPVADMAVRRARLSDAGRATRCSSLRWTRPPITHATLLLSHFSGQWRRAGGMVGGGWYDQILLESEEPLASVDRLRDSCLAAPPAEGGQKGGKMDGLLPALAVSCGESMLSR